MPELLESGPFMQVGEIWAYRERVSDPASPLIPAEILQFGPPNTQKARVRWQGGDYPGLDQWVTKRRLLVRWDEAGAWLRDERLYAQARRASSDANPLEHRTAWEILYVHPIPDGILLEGVEATYGSTVEVSDLDAICKDLDLDKQSLLAEPFAFLDRRGYYIAPWSVARRLTLRVAERYSEAVLAHIAKKEKELQSNAVHGYTFSWTKDGPEHYVPPERSVEDLRQMEPVFALVRRWCGVEAVERFGELTELREEIVRLRALVQKAAARISDAGHPKVAQSLLNEMNGVPLKDGRRRGHQTRAGESNI